MHKNPKVLAAVLAAAAEVSASGCAPDSQASKQAGSLLRGGNVVEGAVKGGITGAATGAAVGGMSGAAADSAAKHRDAIASAEETLGTIQSIAAEESGDQALAASIYPKIVHEDASRGSVDKLRADTLEGVIKVQSARRDHGFPPACK